MRNIIKRILKEEENKNSYLKELSNIINQKLPKVKDGYVRLWRGNRPNEVGLNPSYTKSLDGIALPFYYGYHEQGKEAVISYIDIPKEMESKYEVGGSVPGEEFILPKELLKYHKVVDKNIYKEYEKNIPSDQAVGGLSSADDAINRMFGF